MAEGVKKKKKNPFGTKAKLQEAVSLTAEMERVAELIARGYREDEIADRLGITTEKVLLYTQETPIVQRRISFLLGNFLDRTGNLRKQLYITLLEAAIEDVKKGKFPPNTMMQMLNRLEDQFGDYRKEEEEKKSSPPEEKRDSSIFKKMIIEETVKKDEKNILDLKKNKDF